MPRKRKGQPAKSKRPNGKKLNWTEFNLLENLLICCTVPDGNAPRESGVMFRINSPTKDNLICILFKIDRENDPLIRGDEIRPDYMTFYADKETCVCTIIEMKGTTENRLEHGIEQIKKWRDILRKEIKEPLPNRFFSSLKFQGILLSPPNSQIPNKKIIAEREKGFLILPLQWHAKAELFRYVSVVHKDFVRYEHKPSSHEDGHGFLESVLVENALSKRKQDSYHKANFISDNDERGIYINYKLSNNDYAALCFDSETKSEAAVKEQHANTHSKKVKEHLELIEVGNKSLQVMKID